MKSKKKTVVICIILLVLAVCVITLLNFSPIFSMNPIATGYIEDTKIIAIENQSNNLFLVDTNDGYILFDAGSDSDAVIKGLNKMSIDPDKIKYIFLTHTDYDHVASLNLFANAQIFLSTNEKQMIDETTKRNFFSSNSLPEGIDISSLTLFNDGDKMDLNGYTVECINAPGHTPGLMVYLLNNKYLFTGDAFKVSSDVISVHPYTMDKESAEMTISALDTIFNRSELVFTAHYGYFHSDEISERQ